MLLGVAMLGCLRLCLGEYRYSIGMSATSVQTSVDWLTAAGEIYPWEFKFRSAQAMQLDALVRKVPAVLPLALQSLTLAVRADPTSADLVSRLYLAQRAAARCEDAVETGKWLIQLVPKSKQAKAIVDYAMPGCWLSDRW